MVLNGKKIKNRRPAELAGSLAEPGTGEVKRKTLIEAGVAEFNSDT